MSQPERLSSADEGSAHEQAVDGVTIATSSAALKDNQLEIVRARGRKAVVDSEEDAASKKEKLLALSG